MDDDSAALKAWLDSVLSNPVLDFDRIRRVASEPSSLGSTDNLLIGGSPFPVLDIDATATDQYDNSPDENFSEENTSLANVPHIPNVGAEVEGKTQATNDAVRRLRGIGLLGIVFDELSKQLGSKFSSTDLLNAAQQLIEISRAE